MFNALCATVCVIGVTTTASAALYGPVAVGPVPDGQPGGPAGSVTTALVVTDDFVIDDVTVIFTNLSATWGGDVIATLTHVDSATSATFINRVGGLIDGGAFDVGDGTSFGGDYQFNDVGDDLFAAVDALFNPDVLPAGTYSHINADDLSVFDGLVATGTWQLTIFDAAPDDATSLESWSLELTAIPAPSALAVLGLAGFGGCRRRRRQR
jgi:hypothetical protein